MVDENQGHRALAPCLRRVVQVRNCKVEDDRHPAQRSAARRLRPREVRPGDCIARAVFTSRKGGRPINRALDDSSAADVTDSQIDITAGKKIPALI